jgi:hypothetical protein
VLVKYRNILLSLILVIAWVGVIFYLSANSKGALGDGFALYGWFELTRVLCLGGAGILFLLRVFGLIKQESNLLYCLFATLNGCIGLLGLVLYFCSRLNALALHEFLLSLLVGTILLADILFFSIVFSNPSK